MLYETFTIVDKQGAHVELQGTCNMLFQAPES
jgi:hypothetical protein